MNAEYHEKPPALNHDHFFRTLHSLDVLIGEHERALEELKQKRLAFSEVCQNPGVTYYRLCTYRTVNENPPEWLIVFARDLKSRILFNGDRYFSRGAEGPPPGETRIARVKPTGVDYVMDDDEPTEFCLLVEELP